jgi:hypothetical protein
MAGIEAFTLSPPTINDLEAALEAWERGRLVHVLPAGSSWWRVVRASTPALAIEYAEQCYSSDTLQRFTPVLRDGQIVPAAYAAETDQTALWEVVLRGVRHDGIRRVPQRQVRDRYLVQLRLLRDLRLLNFTKPAVANVVARGRRPPDVTAAWPSAYRGTRQWAQELYARIPAIDGFIYESHQLPHNCIVLLQAPPRDVRVFAAHGNAQSLVEAPARALLDLEAERVDAVIDYGDAPDE